MKIEIKDYEIHMNRLMEILNKLESENLTLDENITLYDEGITLYNSLKDLLNNEIGNLKIYKDGSFINMEGYEID